MLSSFIGLLIMLCSTHSQPLYSSSIDGFLRELSTEENIQELQTFEINMETQITTLKKEISFIKEQNAKLLQILERIQTELTKLENKITNTTKDMSPKLCSPNWILFNFSCYKIVAQKKSWDNAAMKCLQYGAKLVEIESNEENGFLKQRISIYSKYDHFWIGGTDEIIEGRFVWASTGSSLTFTDWNIGEPNNDKSNEDCIEITHKPRRSEMWNDNNCASEFYFICEKTR